MTYPHKDLQDLATIERLKDTAYAEDDRPYLSTQYYTLSPNYEPSDVEAKRRLDTQGAMENMAWYLNNKGEQ